MVKKIQIYGVGCSTCDKLYRMAREIVEELGADVSVEKVEDLNEMLMAGVLRSPGLALDGRVVLQGKVPTRATLRNWILNGKGQ